VQRKQTINDLWRGQMKTIALDQAVAEIPDGATLMIGGFMGVGIGKLVSGKLVRKIIASHIGLNPETQQQMVAGAIEVELVPQGKGEVGMSNQRH
jgi:acetate CoA/acetoacetate CoA-transferase alpha subunit